MGAIGYGRRVVGVVGVLAVSMVPGLAAQAGVEGGVRAGVQVDPVGTLSVNRIPSVMPRITVLGASSAGVLYKVERPPYLGGSHWWTYLKPTGKPAYEVSNDFRALAGDKAYTPYGTVRYLIVGSTVERRCDDAPQPASPHGEKSFTAFTSFGWLSESGQTVAADATGCRVTGAAPNVSGQNLAASDDKGYVLFAGEGPNGQTILEYRSYAAPSQPKVIQTGGRARYVGGMDLLGDVVTWSQLDYDDPAIGASYVVRSSATGGAATVTRVEKVRVHTTAIAGAVTGWAGCAPDHTACSAGSIGAGALPGSYSIAGDGSRFLVDTYGNSPGIDAMRAVPPGQPRTRVVTVGLVPPQTYAVAVGASTVAYVDNQLGMNGEQPRSSAHTRPFTKSGTTLALAAQTRLGEVTDHSVARDGRRTAYVDKAGDLWIVADGGARTKVFDAAPRVAVVYAGGWFPFRLSGHRLLWVKGKYTADHCDHWGCWPDYGDLRLMLSDVRTGRDTDLGGFAYGGAAAVWGNYLAYTGASNRILRRDLSTGAVVQVKGAGARVVGLDVNGTIVAWATCAGNDGYGDCATSRIGYRVMSAPSVVERPSSHSRLVRLTGGHLVHHTRQTLDDARLLKVWRLGTSTVTTIGFLGGDEFDAHDETVVWYGSDMIAKLTPLAAFGARPRYLGNAIGSASFTPNGDGNSDVWAPEFPISKALPTCKITITTGATLRRSLPCATSVGSARVVWDGRDATGRQLPKGRYTWTLTGSDPDGSLLWWNGSASPIRGTTTIA